MAIGLPEVMMLLLTIMLLPAMVALTYGVVSGAFERDEDVKYMALVDGPPPVSDETGVRMPEEPRTSGRRGS